MNPKETIKIDLLTPLCATFFPKENYYTDDETYVSEENSQILDGEDLVQYQELIQKMVERENNICSENGEPCNLMDYFDGSETIKKKVRSATVSVKEVDGVLYGCTTLQMKDFLDNQELKELCMYITGQYSDGWGEGFEQRDIAVDGGDLNVHFFQFKDFHFQERIHKRATEITESKPEKDVRPKMKLFGQNGNIYSILGKARKLLLQNGQGQEVKEMFDRVYQAQSYQEAVQIIGEYVETECSMLKREPKEKQPRNGGKSR